MRGERLVLFIAFVILSEAKNLGLNSEVTQSRNGPEIFRFAQDDSVVGIVLPTLFINAADIYRHARRDRCTDATTSDAYVVASFVSQRARDDRLWA